MKENAVVVNFEGSFGCECGVFKKPNRGKPNFEVPILLFVAEHEKTFSDCGIICMFSEEHLSQLEKWISKCNERPLNNEIDTLKNYYEKV